MPVWARPEHRASTAHSTLIALGSVLYAGVRKHSQESHRRGSSPITPVFPDAGLKEARTELEVLRARRVAVRFVLLLRGYDPKLESRHDFAPLALALAATLAISWTSWRFLEKRLVAAGHRYRY